MTPPALAQALATVQAGQEELDARFNELTDAELSQPGTIGAGDWAAKDLMGHIAFWEELALDTVDMWRAGRRPRVEDMSAPGGTDRANAENQAQTAPQSPAQIRSRAASTHEALLALLHSLSHAEWHASPPYEGATQPTLGDLLGSVLGAPDRPFGHAYAHVDDLADYVRSLGKLNRR